MSVKVSLNIDGIIVNVLTYNFTYNQEMDADNRPSGLAKFEGITIKIESQKAVHLAEWAIAHNQTKQLQLIISPVTQTGKTRILHLFDCHLVGWYNHFSSIGTSPKTETLQITCGGVRENSDTLEYSAPWRETFDVPPPEEKEEEEPETVIESIIWVNADSSEENITELIYTENASLKVKITNPTGAAASFVITKEDGNEFENGDTEIKFTESVAEDGTVELSPFEIKGKWEELKIAKTDKLIAEVSHNKKSKKSEPLELIPRPKVVVDFRPSKNYAGEYGFDYMRNKKDKKDFINYKDILGTNKDVKDPTTGTTKNVFTKYPTDDKYNELKDKEYGTIELPWHKDKAGNKIEYIQNWLAVYPKQKVTLSLQLDTIENPKKLALDFEYDKTLFKLSTDTIEGKSKGKKRLKDYLELECVKEFDEDQLIKVVYGDRLLGQLNVVKNSKKNRYKLPVVFVAVKTQLKKGTIKEGKIAGEQPLFTQFLQQALITSNIIDTDLDLSADATFNKVFAKTGKRYLERLSGIHQYLNSKMDAKYNNYLKIYFIADEYLQFDKHGRETGKIQGKAMDLNSDAVIVLGGHGKATATHEALHALGLMHTFEPSAKNPYSYKKGATYNIMDYSHQADYGSKNRILTWLWQWKVIWANKLVTKE